MKTLQDLISGMAVRGMHGNPDIPVTGLQLDSRLVEPGNLFIAVRGVHTDGHHFIRQAVEKGAAAVICEDLQEGDFGGTAIIVVENAAIAAGSTASAFFDHPSRKLILTGVTGTNGKTTIATLLHELFMAMGYPSGLISTIRIRVNNRSVTSTHTTPDVLSINRHLAEMVEAGCSHVFMEVSSHALVQQRVSGLEFAGGIFTNLTRDHLDYHPDFRSYLEAKKSFFDNLPAKAFALTNSEDRNGKVMLQNCKARQYTYSSRGPADFEGRVEEQTMQGMQLFINGREVWTRFIGRFNASNLLAVYGTAILLGEKPDPVLAALSNLMPVEGRLETVALGRGRTGIVDYAHSPDSLENVLNTLTELRRGGGRIITVFGAGGDRDRGKRPLMAEVACRFSDRIIITSDNPRTENPEAIIAEIRLGVPAAKEKLVLAITNRHEAIKAAAALAMPGDIVLVAGKGHETYQEINGIKHHFDDREELRGLTIDD
jgi:UDP-N-acetylmuramoyl-L-alanyl-D-glutamate--2,6-diaminopimelate ligase